MRESTKLLESWGAVSSGMVGGGGEGGGLLDHGSEPGPGAAHREQGTEDGVGLLPVYAVPGADGAGPETLLVGAADEAFGFGFGLGVFGRSAW